MNPIDVHVGRTLRDRRRAMYLGMHEVAHAIDVDFETLQQMEAGDRRTTAQQIQALCRLYAMVPADVYRHRSPPVAAEGGRRGPPESVC